MTKCSGLTRWRVKASLFFRAYRPLRPFFDCSTSPSGLEPRFAVVESGKFSTPLRVRQEGFGLFRVLPSPYPQKGHVEQVGLLTPLPFNLFYLHLSLPPSFLLFLSLFFTTYMLLHLYVAYTHSKMIAHEVPQWWMMKSCFAPPLFHFSFPRKVSFCRLFVLRETSIFRLCYLFFPPPPNCTAEYFRAFPPPSFFLPPSVDDPEWQAQRMAEFARCLYELR